MSEKLQVYYVFVPSRTEELSINHSEPISSDSVTVKFSVVDFSGKTLTSNTFTASYPLRWEWQNPHPDKDTYIRYEIRSDNGEILGNVGDTLYHAGAYQFGFNTGSVSGSANLVAKGNIKAAIVKNSVLVSPLVSSRIFVLNPNPANAPSHARVGTLKWRLLDESGKVVVEGERVTQPNAVTVFDCAELVGDTRDGKPRFFTFLAQSDYNVIPTLFNCSLGIPSSCEHSQPRYAYYRSGPTSENQGRTVNWIRLIPDKIRSFARLS